MKKVFLLIAVLFVSLHCIAQEDIAFPFQGGSKVMMTFFKDSLKVSRGIIASKATGMVLFKFSADEKGNIKNLVIYYADDAILAPPVIEALKKTDHKWIIPDKEKMHDFIIPFLISFRASDTDTKETSAALHNFYIKRKPILSADQIPLNQATLLPAVVINYDAGQ